MDHCIGAGTGRSHGVEYILTVRRVARAMTQTKPHAPRDGAGALRGQQLRGR